MCQNRRFQKQWNEIGKDVKVMRNYEKPEVVAICSLFRMILWKSRPNTLPTFFVGRPKRRRRRRGRRMRKRKGRRRMYYSYYKYLSLLLKSLYSKQAYKP